MNRVLLIAAGLLLVAVLAALLTVTAAAPSPATEHLLAVTPAPTGTSPSLPPAAPSPGEPPTPDPAGAPTTQLIAGPAPEPAAPATGPALQVTSPATLPAPAADTTASQDQNLALEISLLKDINRDLNNAVDTLRQRVRELEEENARLRAVVPSGGAGGAGGPAASNDPGDAGGPRPRTGANGAATPRDPAAPTTVLPAYPVTANPPSALVPPALANWQVDEWLQGAASQDQQRTVLMTQPVEFLRHLVTDYRIVQGQAPPATPPAPADAVQLPPLLPPADAPLSPRSILCALPPALLPDGTTLMRGDDTLAYVHGSTYPLVQDWFAHRLQPELRDRRFRAAAMIVQCVPHGDGAGSLTDVAGELRMGPVLLGRVNFTLDPSPTLQTLRQAMAAKRAVALTGRIQHVWLLSSALENGAPAPWQIMLQLQDVSLP